VGVGNWHHQGSLRRDRGCARSGGPEVIEVGVEEVAPLRAGEVLDRVEAVGLNHAETLIRSGNYTM
jgi:NADPH2:quinone reductase